MFSRVYVEITNVCNMNCSFCHGTRREARFMSKEEFRSVAERLVGITEYIYLHVLGEPTMHPELDEILDCATGLGFKVAITTNGTLLDSIGELLIAKGVYKVNVSLHSFEDGSKEEEKSYLDCVMDFADRASREGTLTVLRLWNRGHDGGRNEDILQALKTRFGNFEKESARGIRIRDKLHIEYGERFEWPDTKRESLGERVFCHGLIDHIAILSDGTVVHCCLDADGEINLGNAFTDNIGDLLASDRARSISEGFKNKLAVEDLCKSCPYARRFKV